MLAVPWQPIKGSFTWENSAMIDAWFCYWLIVCKTSVQSNRMQERDVHALHLRAGFGDFGDGHDAFACVGGRM